MTPERVLPGRNALSMPSMSDIGNRELEDDMRMLLRAVLDTEAANQASIDGSILESTTRMVEALKAEAAYFVIEDGHRSSLIVFDMDDPSQIPAICEPIFRGAKGRITLSPCMNLNDLTKGFTAFQNSQANQPATQTTS